MTDKFLLSSFIFIIFVVGGILGYIFPEFKVRTTATNTLKKKPSKGAIKRYKISSCVMALIGVILIIITFVGGFKGI